MIRKLKLWNKLLQGLAVGATGLAFGLILWMTGVLQPWEAITWDFRVRSLAKPSPATKEIVLVLLDQKSLDWGKKQMGLSWPWPRELYAAFLDFCSRAGSKAVVLDVLFTEPSPYSVYDDQALKSAIEENDKVVAPFFLSRFRGEQKDLPKHLPEQLPAIKKLAGANSVPSLKKQKYFQATFPIEEVLRSVRLLGNVNLPLLGDAVNLASRLEGVNKLFGTYTLISQETKKLLPASLYCRELGRVCVLGRKEPVIVFEPMSEEIYKQRKKVLESFEVALQLYYQGEIGAARDIFQRIADQDWPAAVYLQKCNQLGEQDLKDWQGVWQMGSK